MSTKKTTDENATSTQTLDPQYSALVYGNVANTEAQAAQPYQPYTGAKVAAFTPAQVQAQNMFTGIGTGNIGQPALDAATAAATKVATYQPTMVAAPVATSTGYQPATSAATNATTSLFNPASAAAVSTASPTDATAASVDRNSIANVNAGLLAGTDLTPYMDPYLSDVVGTTQDALNRQRQIELTQNAGKATLAHGFGGTGAATLDAQTNLNSDQTLASTVATLMSQGYTQAQAQAVADINRKLSADTTNQGVDLNVATTNTGNQQQTNLANAAAGTNTSIFNATSANDAAQSQAARDQAATAANAGAQNQTSIFNAGQQTATDATNAQAKNAASAFGATAANAAQISNANNALTAALANQGAIQAGANIQLQGANALGALSTEQLTDAITKAGLVDAVGQSQQQQQQAALDWAYQNNYIAPQEYQQRMDTLVNQSLGLVPATGTTTSSGTTTTTQPIGLGGILGGVGSILSGVGAVSDERLKEDVTTAGFDGKGRRWVDFKYTADPAGVVHRGVIAQEIEATDPQAVNDTLFGFKTVDYGKLDEAA